MPDIDEIRALVQPGRVHRRVYTDPDIFALEMARIFERCWIYVGHESQIARPGDFIRAPVGRHDILVVRGDDGTIVGLHNRCAHRGAQIVSAHEGSAATFDCPYHGWVYGRDGRLVSLPGREDYGARAACDGRDRGLQRVPAIAAYRGFVFARLCEAGPDLAEFLAPIADSIDNFVDRSPSGEVEYGGNRFRQLFHGNWKLSVENGIDAAHAAFVHRSSAAAAKAWERDHGGFGENAEQIIGQIKSNDIPPQRWRDLDVHGLRNGHGHLGGFYREGKLAPEPDDPVFRAYRRELAALHGAARAGEILAVDRFNSVVYPNLTINIRFQVLRQVQPIAVDRSIVHAVCFRLKGAPEEMFRASVRCLNAFNSPASLISQDDLAVFRRAQDGVRSGADPWIDFSRGAGIDYDVKDGKRGSSGASEVLHRAQYEMWQSLMTAA